MALRYHQDLTFLSDLKRHKNRVFPTNCVRHAKNPPIQAQIERRVFLENAWKGIPVMERYMHTLGSLKPFIKMMVSQKITGADVVYLSIAFYISTVRIPFTQSLLMMSSVRKKCIHLCSVCSSHFVFPVNRMQSVDVSENRRAA